jgi:hypothetical protein
MPEKAIEVRGQAYYRDGSAVAINVQDTTSRTVVAATVKVFARYASHVKQGEVDNYYVEAESGEIVWHTDPVPLMGLAIDHVRDDQRESDPDLSAREAIDYARSILSVPQLDSGDPVSYEAYRKVLLATPAELDVIFAKRG